MSYKINDKSIEGCFDISKKGKVILMEKNQKIDYWQSGFWVGPWSTEGIWKQECGEKVTQVEKIQWTNYMRREIINDIQNTRRHFVGEVSPHLCSSPNISSSMSGHWEKVSLLDTLKLEVAMTLASNTEIWVKARFTTFHFSYASSSALQS